mmetsp:Transcript_176423/g.560394  ORF Transcript_176423/g.560394 Transcript_176423/m.560394 type:complete len:167 (-) Transcript_176423:203-703(-)
MVRLFVAALALVAGVAQSLTVSRGSEEVASGEFQSSLAWTPPALEPAPAVSPSAWWEEKWHPLELIIPVLGVPVRDAGNDLPPDEAANMDVILSTQQAMRVAKAMETLSGLEALAAKRRAQDVWQQTKADKDFTMKLTTEAQAKSHETFKLYEDIQHKIAAAKLKR